MIGLKRHIRHGTVVSVAGHIALLLGLLFAGSGGVRSVPPQVMTVEIVPANEAPGIENNVDGTPLDSTSSGSELESDAEKGSATAAPPQPKTAAPSLQQAQAHSDPQHSASLTAAEAQKAGPVELETEPQASEPLLPPTAPTPQSEPRPIQSATQSNAGEMFAMPLAMPGGRLGGGFDAPASHPAMLPHDDTAAFRARLSSCSHTEPGFEAVDEGVMIVLRIFFKRDGTLASPPKLLDASLSPQAASLLQTAVSALQRCQPFTELPADKYKKWKTIDLRITPVAISGG